MGRAPHSPPGARPPLSPLRAAASPRPGAAPPGGAPARGRSRRRTTAGILLSTTLPALAVGAFAVLNAGASPTQGRAALDAPRLDAATTLATTREPLAPVVSFAGRGRPLVPPAELAGGVRPAPPARIAIPAAEVRAPVDRVGATDAGIEVPALGRAGWYADGPRPGERGRAVVIGHLDTGEGRGLFALLASVRPGAEISVTGADGDQHRFEVVRKRQVPKTAFPADDVYGPSRARELVLVTCGGPWLGDSYRDNVIVFARAAA